MLPADHEAICEMARALDDAPDFWLEPMMQGFAYFHLVNINRWPRLFVLQHVGTACSLQMKTRTLEPCHERS